MRQVYTPTRVARQSGVLAAFPPQTLDLGGRAIAAGYTYGVTGRYEGCERPARFRRGCFGGDQSAQKSPDTLGVFDTDTDPFAVYAGVSSDCLTPNVDGGVTLTDAAAANVGAGFSDAVERELWGLDPLHPAAVDLPADVNVGGQHLTSDIGDPNVVVGTSLAPATAVAELQRAWVDCAGGARLIVFAPVWVASVLRQASLITPSATTLGTYDLGAWGTLVTGSGLFGTAPIVGGAPANGSRNWMIAVRGIDIFASDVRPTYAFDVPSNTGMTVVERFAVVAIDPCCRRAVEVDIAPSSGGGGGGPVSITSLPDLIGTQGACA